MDPSKLLGSLLGNDSMGSNVLSGLLKGGGADISGLLGSLMGGKSGGGLGSILGGLMGGGGGAQPQAAPTPAPQAAPDPAACHQIHEQLGAPAIFRV